MADGGVVMQFASGAMLGHVSHQVANLMFANRQKRACIKRVKLLEQCV